MNENQIILVDKPAGISSFGVVARVRRSLKDQFGHKVKVGHTGTLDPFATGLLILLSGQMTKRSGDFLKLDKVYDATLKLGYTSTTGDPEGSIQQYSLPDRSQVTTEKEGANPVTTGVSDPGPEVNTVEATLSSFLGPQLQTVPPFSAVKINGERAYKLARAGKTFETPTREIEIYSIELLNYDFPELTIRCHVSSGTYVRTLAADIGKKLGTGAYLTALRRLKIGDYDIKNAVPLDQFSSQPADKVL